MNEQRPIVLELTPEALEGVIALSEVALTRAQSQGITPNEVGGYFALHRALTVTLARSKGAALTMNEKQDHANRAEDLADHPLVQAFVDAFVAERPADTCTREEAMTLVRTVAQIILAGARGFDPAILTATPEELSAVERESVARAAMTCRTCWRELRMHEAAGATVCSGCDLAPGTCDCRPMAGTPPSLPHFVQEPDPPPLHFMLVACSAGHFAHVLNDWMAIVPDRRCPREDCDALIKVLSIAAANQSACDGARKAAIDRYGMPHGRFMVLNASPDPREFQARCMDCGCPLTLEEAGRFNFEGQVRL